MISLLVTELSLRTMLGIAAVVIPGAILAVVCFALRAAAEKPLGVAEAEAKFLKSLDGHE